MPDHEFQGAIPRTSSHQYDGEGTAEEAFRELFEGLEGDYDLRQIGSVEAIYQGDNKSPVATRDGSYVTVLDEEAEETLKDLGYELEAEK